MDETIPDVGFSIGTIQRKKPVSKHTNPETFWNNFDKIISITKLKLENPKWGPVKMANMVHTEKPVTLTVHDLGFSKYYTFHSLISMVL
jgi:hypothetical protein